MRHGLPDFYGLPVRRVPEAYVLEECHRQELLAPGRPVPQALGEMLGYYFRFYESQFGRACSAMHDPLAAALAVGGVSAAVAPVVTVDVDTTDGPVRGQTICDLRGRYMDYPEQPGARCRVVLELDGDFAPHLVEVLQGFADLESTTAAVAAGAAAA
jgi:purine nucleosidase